MSLQELKDRAYQLPIHDRLELIEAIVVSLKTEKIAATAIANDPNRTEKQVRNGWDEALKAMSKNGDDQLEEGWGNMTIQWDDEEWEW